VPGPPQLFDNIDGGPIKIVAGDPKTIRLRIKGSDRTNSQFQASVRHRAKDTNIITDFSITKYLETVDDVPYTVLDLKLAGDSGPGLKDGQSRFGGAREAVCDVQQWGLFGAEVTIATFEIEVLQDVTR
jgi:hypothetical protein